MVKTDNSPLTTQTKCFNYRVQATNLFQSRVGSSFASSGGTVHSTRLINVHPQYIPELTSSDIAVIRTLTSITYIPNAVAAGSIAGPNYVIADNQPLWASGWGFTSVSYIQFQFLGALLLVFQSYTSSLATCLCPIVWSFKADFRVLLRFHQTITKILH